MTAVPAEWARQQAIWTAFPSDASLWEADLAPAQAEVAGLVRALARTVPVRLLASGAEAAAAARRSLGDVAEIHETAFGDIWLRDTGPIFLNAREARAFRFNGWGGKYDLPGDQDLADRVADMAGAGLTRFDLVCEGGALDSDGQGLAITTEQCLLNPNRNPGLSKRDIEQILKAALGIRRLVWLGEGLRNDHTDGHVDNLARFVAPGTVMIPVASGPDDPNAPVFADARARAGEAGLVVLDCPSVGRFVFEDDVVPASHMNFVVANGQVIVPLYGGQSDAAALKAVARAFPRHRVSGLPSSHILTGGGSFHCITQQQPEAHP
ncbi:MAG: agmatine deiminase family protein [Sphingomonadaceae bacterium]